MPFTNSYSIGLRYALKKVTALEKTFGTDSQITKFAKQAVESKLVDLPDKYISTAKDGTENINVGAVEKDFARSSKRIEELQHKVDTATDDKLKATYQQNLRLEKANYRQLRSLVEIGGREVKSALQTERQILTSEIKSTKDWFAEKGGTLTEIEQFIVNAKTQKEVLANEEAKRYLAQRANETAIMMTIYDKIEHNVYEIMTDNDVPQSTRDDAKALYENRTMSASWIKQAEALVTSWYGDIYERYKESMLS